MTIKSRLARLEKQFPPKQSEDSSEDSPAGELTAEQLLERLERWVGDVTYHPNNLFEVADPDFHKLWLAYGQLDNHYSWRRTPEGYWQLVARRFRKNRVWERRAEPDLEAARLAVLRSMVRTLEADKDSGKRVLGEFFRNCLENPSWCEGSDDTSDLEAAEDGRGSIERQNRTT
jgi:hypothetical protein